MRPLKILLNYVMLFLPTGILFLIVVAVHGLDKASRDVLAGEAWFWE